MGIADALNDGPPKNGQVNGLKLWLGRLDADERAAAITMLDDERWSTPKVFEVFARSGFTMSASHLHKLRAARAWV